MVRLVALALAGAFVLGVGPTEDRRGAKEKYVAAVRGAVQEESLARLLDEVIDFDRVGCRVPHLLCRPDERTAVGRDWLRAEDRLQAEMDAVARRLQRVKPPEEVATEHAALIAALRSCVLGIPALESELPRVARWEDNVVAVEAFQKTVGRSVRCFPRLYEIGGEFEDKHYLFLPGSLGGLVDAYGYYGLMG